MKSRTFHPPSVICFGARTARATLSPAMSTPSSARICSPEAVADGRRGALMDVDENSPLFDSQFDCRPYVLVAMTDGAEA